ncbi:transglycosylase domain-containing protein [Fulvivirgaceae bacterium PWU4]|uniref:Transglycosylase domain-containing protein n=1 Tax=Chryseosolibacter histidini TaxID=2782349 RepID=A0AAP2DPA9_9BACT|nr:transglycosylase domain-containing protein [Chryseosolibacter histidini]MBT1700065.1 transglycosylase domain-containing protein [Chryseosolibacter histidini]
MPDLLRSLLNRLRALGHRPGIFRRIFKLILLLVAGVAGVVLLLVLLVWAGAFGAIPDKEDLDNIQHPLASEVYSADSVLLGRYYLQERSPVTLPELPNNLKQALIATEDSRFYEHNGVDLKSLFRVLIKTILLQDEGSGGGSTLTQQLAKNLFPRKSHGALSMPVNKIREFIIARRLEKVYSKDEIILLYLNTIPFADNTYGIKTAADRFFSTAVKELTVDQSAVLVGMLKATHSYNPRLFPERSLQRRNVVIAQMEKYGYIKPWESKTYQAKPLALHYNATTHNAGLAPYFRAYIQRELLEWCKEHRKPDGSPYNLYTDGLKIYTTIDSRLQRYAEEAMKAQMKTLQERFEKQLNTSRLATIARDKLRLLPQYQTLKKEGLTEKEIMARLKAPVKTKVFTWKGDREVKMSVYDSLKHYIQFLQAGVMAMDPQHGSVKVWVGGIDHRFFQYDHVRETTKRQVGSTLKPLLYAAALERGVSPCDYISARKTSYTNMEGWTPENTEEETYERKYSMEGGLSGSVNTVSVKILEKTGIDNAITMIRNMGIKSNLPAVPSLALGTPSISVMEMVTAYSVLANQGVYLEPYYLETITDQQGNVLESATERRKGSRVLSRETTQMMLHMLQSVVSEGTGAALRNKYGITNDVAGKTGTTQSNVDGWFMAVMPRLVIGTWVGADDPRLHFRSTTLGQGAATALPIVAGLLQRANQDKTLSPVMQARFAPLSSQLLDRMDCKPSKSNKNFFERIFRKNKKKSVKVTKFKRG